MILKNYMVIKECILNATASGASTMLTNYTDMSGTARSGFYGNYAPLGTALKVVLGTGDTAPTATDYALDTDVTSSFSSVTLSAATRTIGVDDNGKPYIKHAHTISAVNSSGADITIKEFGIYYDEFHYQSGSYYCDVLLSRDVISPVTVAAGDSFTLPIEWIEY